MSKIIFNGVDYAGGSGNYFNPVIYSDVERKVGVWRDNKPLYQKTVHINALPSSAGSQQYAHNIANIDKVCHYESISRASSGSSVILNRVGLNGANFNGAVSYDVFVNTTVINITVGQDRSNIEADVTIWYTKTTDVAGSGDYNTLGVPTEHYDASEQVVGTWFGKPLYQKTINFGALPNNESKKVNHNIANVKRIWIYDGYAFNSVSGYCNQLNLSGTSNISSQWYCGCTDTFVEVRPNSDRTAYDECYITVRYTKTTD